MRALRVLAAVALLGVVATLAAQPARAGRRTAGHTPRTPIHHFISLMQANHSFDNYFGTYPGADGIPAGICMPIRPDEPKAGCVKPFRLGNRSVTDLGHTLSVFARQRNGGRMDGFVSVSRRQGLTSSYPMGYYDGSDIPYYWNVADRYVLFDRFFTSAGAGSVWNHMYWVTGTPGNPVDDSVPPEGFGSVPTIFDRLEQAGVSWKFYVQNYDPTINFRTVRQGDKGEHGQQIVRVPLLSYARYVDNPKLRRHIVPIDEYFSDVAHDTLPAVSYIVPSGASEHPPSRPQAGERFVRSLLNALASSSLWRSSAFIWTYDDWGGWYDHVKPPRVDKYGYGFRAPALLVSAYARRGYVDHTQLDFTSIPKFIEENWNLPPLAPRDAAANSIAGALDFRAGPRPPEYVPVDRIVKPLPEGRRPVIYASYGVALCLALALLAAPHIFASRPHPPVLAWARRPRLSAPRWARRPSAQRPPELRPDLAAEKLGTQLEALIRVLRERPPDMYMSYLPGTGAEGTEPRTGADMAAVLVDDGAGPLVVLDDGAGVLKVFGATSLAHCQSALEGDDGVEPPPGRLHMPVARDGRTVGLVMAERHGRDGDHTLAFTDERLQSLIAFARELSVPPRDVVLLRRLKRELGGGAR